MKKLTRRIDDGIMSDNIKNPDKRFLNRMYYTIERMKRDGRMV